MIKTTLLGSALAVALSAAAMAGDFHALAGLQGAIPSPLQDEALAATEGGFFCNQDRIQERHSHVSRLVTGNLGRFAGDFAHARTGQGTVAGRERDLGLMR